MSAGQKLAGPGLTCILTNYDARRKTGEEDQIFSRLVNRSTVFSPTSPTLPSSHLNGAARPPFLNSKLVRSSLLYNRAKSRKIRLFVFGVVCATFCELIFPTAQSVY
jgi:hypothetical protein